MDELGQRRWPRTRSLLALLSSFMPCMKALMGTPNLLVIELFETENVLLIYLIYLLIFPANRQTYWSQCTLIRKIFKKSTLSSGHRRRWQLFQIVSQNILVSVAKIPGQKTFFFTELFAHSYPSGLVSRPPRPITTYQNS